MLTWCLPRIHIWFTLLIIWTTNGFVPILNNRKYHSLHRTSNSNRYHVTTTPTSTSIAPYENAAAEDKNIAMLTVNDEEQEQAAIHFERIDVDAYLAEVETHLRSSSSSCSSRYQNESKDHHDHREVVIMKISETHRRTMLRTLLGIPNKIELNRQMRDVKKKLQYSRMKAFLSERLPILSKNNTINNTLLAERAPNFEVGRRIALHPMPLSKVKKNGDAMCSPMAKGKYYRGNFTMLLQDLAAPSYSSLVEEYRRAKRVLSETEIMIALVEENAAAFDLDCIRVEAAKRCIYCDLPESPSGLAMNGSDCEDICADFLRERQKNSTATVFRNVLVKPIGHKPKRHKTPKHVRTCCPKKDGSTGAIISTSVPLDGSTSEFDAVIIEQQQQQNCHVYISEVWEAKTTINPATLLDSINKKRTAFQSILADPSATFSQSCSQVGSGSSYIHNGTPILDAQPNLFGIFGIRLMPPANAANSLRLFACSRALTGDANVVLEALDTGFVQADVESAVERLHKLRSALLDMKEEFMVITRKC